MFRTRLDDGLMLTTAQLTRRLDVTPLTVLFWRRGTSKRVPLPVAYESRSTKSHHVRFAEADLLAWLSQYRPDLYNKWVSQ